MCPACAVSVAMMVASVVSAGGLAAAAAKLKAKVRFTGTDLSKRS